MYQHLRPEQTPTTYGNKTSGDLQEVDFRYVGSQRLPYELDSSVNVDDAETQFQIGIEAPLAITLFNTVDLYAAYTDRSFWQVHNSDISRLFRETNHEPEIWGQFRP